MSPEASRVHHACGVCGGEITIMREFREGHDDDWVAVHTNCLREARRVGPNWHHGANQVPVSIGIAEMEEGDGYQVMALVGRAPVEARVHRRNIQVGDFVPCEGVSWPRLDEVMGEGQ